uniref:Fibronectin type-III domain-containing protein n=1 Tax=Globodera rostochiensis TaxID=31243 RepID=A0A914HBE2_GLORO
MSPSSAGHQQQSRLRFRPNLLLMLMLRLFLLLFLAHFICPSLNIPNSAIQIRAQQTFNVLPPPTESLSRRHRRATTESLLTVEWEGIQSGDHPDSSIRGFIVEYRAEKEHQWNVHSGMIPYKGPNHQYRVQIPKLPTGISYFVRIKVLGEKGEVLVETPEIRARNEIVSIKCEPDEISAPGDVDVKERAQFSVALAWQAPECGSIGQYQIELHGLDSQQFDVHRQTVAQPSASITGLLSGSEYAVKIRAVDRAHIVGPWNDELFTVSTKGEVPEQSNEVHLDYAGSTEARIRWKHLDDARLQHYEVVLSEMVTTPEGQKQSSSPEGNVAEVGERMERSRLGPSQDSAFFAELRPDRQYRVGVVAYVDHEPKRIYHVTIRTNTAPMQELSQKPVVVEMGDNGQHEVHWKSEPSIPVSHFVVEFRPGNESKWRRANAEAEPSKAANGPESLSLRVRELGDNAFSVRVVFVDEQKRAVAVTGEQLIAHSAGAKSCERMAPVEPTVGEVDAHSVQFSWQRPDCEGDIQGYEYAIWPTDQSPPETTSFTVQPSASVDELEPASAYTFRVRSRLLHGHSQWSVPIDVNTAEQKLEEDTDTEQNASAENLYRLRIVLAPPQSFLVWTPLPEHRANIARFKVSYKPTASSSAQWTALIRSPAELKCPPGLSSSNTAEAAAAADFCMNLNGLDFGRQYEAEVVYELNEPKGNRWSRRGSPLFFILVESSSEEEEEPAGIGTAPPAPVDEAAGILLSQLRVEPMDGPKSVVRWKAIGQSLGDVRAYQVEVRGGPEQAWRPASGYIPGGDPVKKEFRTEVDAALLAGDVDLRVRAVGADGKSIGVSERIQAGSPCRVLSRAPTEVSLVRHGVSTLALRWHFPADASGVVDQCQLHFLVGGILDGSTFQRTVDGRARELRLETAGGRAAAFSVHAINRLGAGPASVPVSVDEGGHGREATALAKAKTLVSTPNFSQSTDGSLQVKWRSEGSGRGVFGYRLLYRAPGAGWNPFGQIVPYVGDGEEYSVSLSGLSVGVPYEVQIQALDRNSYVLYTSPEVRSSPTCLAPLQPPSNLAIDTPDPGHVRVTWAPPPQGVWRCASAEVELQIDEPRGRSPSTVDATRSSHVFESGPDQRWTLRARTRNSAGHSPWSTSVSALTVSAASASLQEPIEGPFVTFVHGTPRLSWRSRDNAGELVDHFVVEWRRRTEQRWNELSRKIPFAGWQRPYSVDLDLLPAGHVYEVRVKAVDHNMGTAFVSGTNTVQAQGKCGLPRSSPRNVQVTPLGPTQVQLNWQGLSEPEWNCDRLWYLVKYSSAEAQGFRNLTQSETSTVFNSKPFTQWQFEVQAANPAGASPWSAPQRAQTLSTAPGPVAELNAQTLGADAVQLHWGAPQLPNGQIMGYEITYQLVSRGMCSNAADHSPTTLVAERPSYTLQQLHAHSKYRIGVAARTQLGAGERVTREVQTDQSAPTAPPANFRVDSVGEQNAEMSWHAPPCVHTNGDITEYEYEIAAADRLSAQIPRLTDVTRTTRVHLTGLLPATAYSARVRAFTARGAGPWSPEVRFQTRAVALSVVQYNPNPRVYTTGPQEAQMVWQTNQQGANYFDKFACQWAPVGTQQYVEERVFPAYSPCDLQVVQRHQLPPSTTQLQTHCGPITGLSRDPAVFDYRVRAKPREQPWQAWSAPQRPVQPAPPPPPRPRPVHPPPPPPVAVPVVECVRLSSLHKTGGSPNSLHFAWSLLPSDVLHCTAFRVEVTPRDGREPARQFMVDGTTLQYVVDALRPATAYAVTVEPLVNERRCKGLTVDMTTDAEPLVQLNRPRVVEERATSITIAWDVPPSTQCSAFIVENRVDSGPAAGPWTQDDRRVPCQHGRATYTATVPDLPTNTAVDLRVRVLSPQNQPSSPSPEVRGHTKCSPPDSPPHGLRLDSPSPSEVRVSWARLAKNSWNCDELNVDIGYRTGNQPERILTVPGDKVEQLFPSEPNTGWTIRLRASNQMGNSPWGPEQSITTRQGAPGAVLNMRLTPLSPNELRVQWDPPSVQRGTVVGYDISYRLKHRLACPEEEPRDVSREWVTIYNYKDTDYTLTGLLPNSLYEVKVRARTTELGPEETREGATLQQPPSAPPFNLQLTYALERSLSFQWEPVECSQRHGQILAYEYEIVGQDDWAKLERQIANTSETRVTIDGLTPYTKYVFRVRAYNAVGGGPATENLDVMTAKANAPLPPQDLVVTQEGVSWFVVSWLPPYPPYGPHDRYKLQYQLLNAHDWQSIEVDTRDRRLECPVPGPRLCFNITALDQGQQYRVKVAAHIEAGSYGPYSLPVIANTLQVLPEAPMSIQLIAKTDHSLHIGWKSPLDPYGHITQYRLSWQSLARSDQPRQSQLVDHPQLQYLIDGLEPETDYNITLSAGTVRGFGPEIWARFRTDPFKVPSVLNAPIVIPEGAHTLHVEWQGVHDAHGRVAGYIVEIRTSDAPQWTEMGGVVRHEPGRRTYKTRLDGLEPDTLYFVRIKVVDHRQRVSDASPEAQARTGCAPPSAPPTNVALTSAVDWRQVRVSWQPPSKQSWLCSTIGYRVQYKNGTQPTQEAKVPSGSLEHTLPSGPSTEWCVRVKGENGAGASPWSEEVCLHTRGGPPGAPTELHVEPGVREATATWKEPEAEDEITGYTLTYTLRSIGECGPSSAKPIVKQSREPRIDLDGLLPDSVYDVFVTARTTVDGPPSKVVSVRTLEAPPTGQPQNVRVSSVTATRAELLWNEIDCELRHGRITGYDFELDNLGGDGQNITRQSSTHRVSLDGLTPWTEYRARVRGKNSRGEGPFSEYVQFRTLPAAPPPPTDLREEQQLAHALEISFLPPYPPNGILDQYRIRWTVHGKFNYREQRVPAFELECSDARMKGRLCYRISGLEPEQEYEIQAAAHTERGDWSDWSEPLVTRTVEQEIPVLEHPLELEFAKSTSIGVRWRGLEERLAEHITGYVLEYKSETDTDWKEWNGVVRHRARQPDYRAHVKGLTESTEYFFRLRVVGKGDKRGGPGPELKAMTKCGKPEQPPGNVHIAPIDFQQVRISWEPPDESTWKCDSVELVLHYSNGTGAPRTQTFAVDGPREAVFDSVPGTRWEGKMRTQTLEPGEEPQHSKWGPRAVLVTKSSPTEVFLKVTPREDPAQADAFWDLPADYQDWPWGVDLQYRLVRLGGCRKLSKADMEPVIMENVQDKQVLLDNLHPGSEYEVTVTLRQPPGLDRRMPPKKAVQRFQTADQPPSGAPHKLRVEGRWDTKLAFGWEPPECLEQNGEISQYEYELSGLDEWNQGTRQGVSPRTRADIGELQPGSLYRFRVRAFTSAGPGPWSEPIDARTTGSELGAPRDLSAIKSLENAIQLAWLPPHPETSPVIAYRLRYGPAAGTYRPQEVLLQGDELNCAGYESTILTGEHQCTVATGLKPATMYRFAVQAQASSGNWGPFTSDSFGTTEPELKQLLVGGQLKLIGSGHDYLRVRWMAPPSVVAHIERYELHIQPAARPPIQQQPPQRHEVPDSQTDFHFKGLQPVTLYNVTVHGLAQQDKSLWRISDNFPTTDITEQSLAWLSSWCTPLTLVEKSDSMLHVTWTPPDVYEPEFRDLLTHYRVTIAPVDALSMKAGGRKNFTVPVPGNSIKFNELQPDTIYNITVQGGTDNGYGATVWGSWATLSPGKTWILRLKDRTPGSLTVEWDPVWGIAHRGYILTAKAIHSTHPFLRIGSIRTLDVPSTATEFAIRGLEPTSTYNVTLQLKDQMDGAWSIYSTLQPGCFLPGDIRHCDQTRYATSMSWEPVVGGAGTHYQVRYIHLHQTRTLWVEEPERHRMDLLCPKDPCGRLCYLVFNLPNPPEEYAFMVRARVDGRWNNWKLAGRPTVAESPEVKENCCIVPPPYHVTNIGLDGTQWAVPIAPSPTDRNITRYYVVVDERDPPGDTNWTVLTDKVTANRLHVPYYVTASYSTETLTTPMHVKIGDGQVLGGYLNYPLQKGKTYNYEIYTKWMMHGDQPVIARQRASEFLAAGWPWWWLLLLLLLLLLCIPLCCLLAWLLARQRRRRYVNGRERERLLRDEKAEHYERSRGDFEDGYAHGYRASRGGGRMDEEYRGRDEAFREGYAKGLRDAGERAMSTSMANLAQRPTQRLGYSSGYMQGFRDGNSGVFGDRISESLLRRLEEQYPDNEEFRAGYIDGFKDGVSGGGRAFEDTRRMQQSLTELTERLTTIEKVVEKEKGDELHSTKIYHVYNQSPELLAQGQQLVNELEELASGQSRRSTLRRHYTPGDYLRYEDAANASGAEYHSLGRRRTMSASALGRESSSVGRAGPFFGIDERQRHHSGASLEGIRADEREEVLRETFTRSVHGTQHRSRSELMGGGVSPPRRYASQTLLDGARPGPILSTHSRRDALQELQRELDSLASRSPAGVAPSTYQQQQQQSATARNYEYESAAGVAGASGTSAAVTHQWPDDLIEIVHEPMGHTLDRMRRFSTSLSNVEGREGTATATAAAAAESEKVEEKYRRTYREEYSGGGGSERR